MPPLAPLKLIIDENLSEEVGSRFESFLEKRKIQISEVVFVAQMFPGMPDDRIIIHLLNQDTILLTADRPFHAKVLAKKLKSYYYTGEGFTSARLKGIKIVERSHKKDLIPKNSYQIPKTENRSLVMCLSEKQLKKMRTKRRRIRNYFGGLDHMAESAVTVSFIPKSQKTLIGVKIKIASNTGIKGLDASENYFEETASDHSPGDLALSCALILPMQLMLNQIKTIVYYDAHCIKEVELNSEKKISRLFKLLKESFGEIDFFPVKKGFHIEKLRKKLNDLSRSESNEIVTGYFSRVLENFRDDYWHETL